MHSSTLACRQCSYLLIRRCHLQSLDESALDILLVRTGLIEEKSIEMMNGDHVQEWLDRLSDLCTRQELSIVSDHVKIIFMRNEEWFKGKEKLKVERTEMSANRTRGRSLLDPVSVEDSSEGLNVPSTHVSVVERDRFVAEERADNSRRGRHRMSTPRTARPARSS